MSRALTLRTVGGLVPAAFLLVFGLSGFLTVTWGYAFFVIAAGLWGIAILAFGTFVFTHCIDTRKLLGYCKFFFFSGLWAYLGCIGAFSGFFAYEAFLGRVELRYMLFGPAILAALGILEYGVYRALISRNRATFERYRRFISRERVNVKQMRRVLLDDIILHKSLYQVSFIRWLRHTLILWGFMLLVLLEILRVFVQEAMPSFGLPDVWHIEEHPIRLSIGFLYDLFGLMVVLGCILAIAWRISVGNSEQKKFSDTPTVWFLLFVMMSGFLVESVRIAETDMSATYLRYEFVGYAMAIPLKHYGISLMSFYDTLWIVHVLGSCLFIAYVPLKRLIHSCATPFGRLINSQKDMLAEKKHKILAALSNITRE